MMSQFQTAAYQDPFYNDPAAIYGKVSDPSALALNPMYGFFLEETNTDDHDNDGIDDLNDLDDDNDGINDLVVLEQIPLTTIMMGLGTSLTGMTTMTGYWRAQSTTHRETTRGM